MEQIEFSNKETKPAAHDTNHQNRHENSRHSNQAENPISSTEFTALAVGLASMASSNEIINQHNHRNANVIEPNQKNDENIRQTGQARLREEDALAEITKLVSQAHQSHTTSSEELTITTSLANYTSPITRNVRHPITNDHESMTNQPNRDNETIGSGSNTNVMIDMTQSTLSQNQLEYSNLHHSQSSRETHLNDIDVNSIDQSLGNSDIGTVANEFLDTSSRSKNTNEQSNSNSTPQQIPSTSVSDTEIYNSSRELRNDTLTDTHSQMIPSTLADSHQPVLIPSIFSGSNGNESLQQLSSTKETRCREICQFCGHVFSHPGSLGRHLDLKRGTRLHPSDQIDLIRKNVKRRGDVVEVKARRAKRARVYNSREDVRERSRLRRRQKEREEKARIKANEAFIESIGKPTLPPHPSFAYLVLFFLPPTQWPHDPPTSQTLGLLKRTLEGFFSQAEEGETLDISEPQPEPRDDSQLNISNNLFEEYTNKVNVAFEQWRLMNKASKMTIWAREQRRIAEAALGSLSLYDLGTRDKWIDKEKRRLILDEEKKEKLKDDENKIKNEKDYDSDNSRSTIMNDNSQVQSLETSEEHIELGISTDHSKEIETRDSLNEKLGNEMYS